MSDDQHNDPQRQGRPHSGHPQSQNYGQEDDKTQMVDLNELQKGGPEPQFAPPPTMDSSEATQLFEIPPSMGNQDGDGITSSAPDYSDPSYGQNAPPPVGQPQGNFGSGPVSSGSNFGSGPVSSGSNFGSGPVSSGSNFGSGPVSGPQGRPPQHHGSGQQSFAPNEDEAGYEGSTQFISIADFAQKEAHFTPEQQQAGYQGSTQFVDINALQAGAAAMAAGDSIENDADLKRGYQFTPGDIERGEVTLIRAKNPLGKDVILKRVWEGDPQSMSTPLRQRVAQLNDLRHPNLVPMNGMFVSASGMWVELDAPRGQSLTKVLQTNGPQIAGQVIEWMGSIAAALETIHSQQLAYANLTTDSVWIDTSTGQVQIEPFDMLRLADRGNLGAFGPPEMDAPPEQRQLSPATDVFSLAAVGAAAITGLPFQPQKLAQLEDTKLADKLAVAMAPNPAERPQSTMDFVGTLTGGLDLDIRLVAGAGGGVVLLLLVLALVFSGGDDPHTQVAQPDQPLNGEPSTDVDQLMQQAATGGGGDEQDAPSAPAVDLPGQTTTDPRLSIKNSFAQNPPTTAVRSASGDELEEWRQQANEYIKKGDDAPRSDRHHHYMQGLQVLTQIIRAQDDPDPSDSKAWRDLLEKETVSEEIKELRDEVQEMLLSGNLGQARRTYRRLARFDPGANSEAFINTHNSARVVTVKRQQSDDDDEDDD